MDELQEYFNNILAHLDAMAKRTIFMMGVEYGKQKSREQESNFSGGFSTEEKTETMLINLSGVSINSKPRADGRYQGYAMRDGEKKYFYGTPPKKYETRSKSTLKAHLPRIRQKFSCNLLRADLFPFCSDFFWQPDCASAKRWR